jgi:hypothetical protein
LGREHVDVAENVHLAYDAAGLRAGAGGLREVSGAAADAGAALAAAAVDPVMFGRTAAAPVFAAAVAAAQAVQARGFRYESQRSTGLAERGDTAAGLGDDLTARTGSVARSATPEPR